MIGNLRIFDFTKFFYFFRVRGNIAVMRDVYIYLLTIVNHDGKHEMKFTVEALGNNFQKHLNESLLKLHNVIGLLPFFSKTAPRILMKLCM